MLQSEQGITHQIEVQQKLYLAYAQAAEKYARKPTLDNWVEKEDAFDIYNHSIQPNKEN